MESKLEVSPSPTKSSAKYLVGGISRTDNPSIARRAVDYVAGIAARKTENHLVDLIQSHKWVELYAKLDKIDPQNKPVLNLEGDQSKKDVRYVRQGSGLGDTVAAHFHEFTKGTQTFAIDSNTEGKVVIFGGDKELTFRADSVRRTLEGEGKFQASLIKDQQVQVPLIDRKSGKVRVMTIPLIDYQKLSVSLKDTEIRSGKLIIGDHAGESDKGVAREKDEDSYLIAIRGDRPNYQLANAAIQLGAQIEASKKQGGAITPQIIEETGANIAADQYLQLERFVDSVLTDKTGVDGILIVADGMGGHSSGEYASQKAIMKIIYQLSQSPNFNGLSPEEAKVKITEIVKESNNDIALGNEKTKKDSGSTLAMVIVVNGNAYTIHSGDSRVYMLDEHDNLNQLTKDHSLVEYLISTGQATEDERRTHDQRNEITSYIGKKNATITVSDPIKITGKSKFAVVCDGVWEEMSDSKLRELLSAKKSTSLICKDIINEANQNGGNDNITAVVAEVSVN